MASKPKREAKAVERLDVGVVKEKEAFKVVPGKGMKLRDIANVDLRIGKIVSSSEELKLLHRICFGTPGQKTVVKKHLREFSGFEEGQLEEKTKTIGRLDGGLLKKVMMLCDVPTTGTKIEQAARLAAFLDSPTPSGKKSDVQKLGEKRKRGEKKAKASAKAKGKASPANKIKRPLSAYFLYCNNKRDKVRAENPGASVGEIAKILGAKWKSISDERKANYMKQAAELKAEYDAKVAKAGGAAKAPGGKKAKAAAASEKDADDDEKEEKDEESEDDEEGGDEDGADEEGAGEDGADEEGGGEDGADEEGGDEAGDADAEEGGEGGDAEGEGGGDEETEEKAEKGNDDDEKDEEEEETQPKKKKKKQ